MNRFFLLFKTHIFLILILLSSVLLIYPLNSNASHIMGGEITIEQLPNDTHIVHMVLYRDTTGIPGPLAPNLELNDFFQNVIGTLTLQKDTSYFVLGVAYGVEVFFYSSTALSLPSNIWSISWSTCCRNGSIMNLGPGTWDSFFYTEFNLSISNGNNSTPVFLAPPILKVPVDTLWQYNPMPYDVDGDSLSWSIVAPWAMNNLPLAGWTLPSGHPNGIFSIDPNTGQIDWTPDLLGNFVATILVEEYRTGIKIGEIRRDMQFIVRPDSAFSARIVNFNTFPINSNGIAELNLLANEPYSVTLIATDTQNDTIELFSYGEPYIIDTSQATFNSNFIAPDSSTGTFSWTPDFHHAREKPYFVSFRTSNGSNLYDETLQINVGTPIMGGEITAHHLGNSLFKLNISIYRDTSAIPLSPYLIFTIEDTVTNLIQTFNAELDSSRMGTDYGYQGLYYSSNPIMLNSNTVYIYRLSLCCRDNVVLNSTDPGLQPVYLETTFSTNDTPDHNSTPKFLSSPLTYLSINVPWQYNPMPYDADGDSLAWSIVAPLNSSANPIPGWIVPNSNPNGPFNINANTGQINWEPNILGNFIASVLVKEYRSGIKIGEIRRDMQFIVVPNFVSAPTITNFNILPLNTNGDAEIKIEAGSTYQIVLGAKDFQNDSVEIQSVGEPYLLDTLEATFINNYVTADSSTGTFTWTPEINHARVEPYSISFRTSNGSKAFDQTLLIDVVTNIVGGEITAESFGGTLFQINLNVYRDLQASTIPKSTKIKIKNTVTGSTQFLTANLDSAYINNPVGVLESIYKTVQLSLNAGAEYELSWKVCCRDKDVLNSTNAGSQSFHFRTIFFTSQNQIYNSTPELLSPPVAFLPINTPWRNNPVPYDKDGDSLIWTVVAPLNNSGAPVSGWVVPNSNLANPFSINAKNGQIDWTPNLPGKFITSVLVEEFRMGAKIGEIRRDMQFFVDTDSSLSPPLIGNFNVIPIDSNSNASLNLNIGTPAIINFIAGDIQNDSINFLSYGEPFELSLNAASFTSSYSSPGQASGIFSWTPNASQARMNPYIVSFRVSDSLMAFDETILISVGNFSGIEQNENDGFGLGYPNPTQNIFFVPFELKKSSSIKFEVFDLNGNKVVVDIIKQYHTGSNIEKFNLELPSGIYFLIISNDEKQISSRKIVVNN